jgi:hypothetical protein
MDEGPFRTSRSADKRVTARAEPARRQPVAEQPAEEQPRVVSQAAAPRGVAREASLPRRFKLPIIIILSVIILALAAWFASSQLQSSNTAIQADKYQAVFFTNGQVYFGKLHTFHNGYLRLTDIYYLQTQNATSTDSKNPQQTTTDQSNVQLIKLGDEIHGPQDEMIISKDQVLFYENLKSDGKVAQSITKYKK